MKSYLECWIDVASSLFSQALAGEPEFVEALPRPMEGEEVTFTVQLNGEVAGEFVVILDGSVLESPLMGEGIDQQGAWGELLRETAEAAAGELLARSGKHTRIEKFETGGAASPITRAFALKAGDRQWAVQVRERVRDLAAACATGQSGKAAVSSQATSESAPPSRLSPGLELLLDVELEASLRFGSRELPLGEILDLGPGDVVQLDRQVADPVDLVVADKIVARGEVVLVNGNFGLRVTEVVAPRRRLESIRCLF